MPVTPINSIQIPDEYFGVCADWYGGMDCMLYAISSTGGLTTGTSCPVIDYDDIHDRSRKWYYSLWSQLSVDVGRAHRGAQALLARYTDTEGYADAQSDCDTLNLFEDWVDGIVARLEIEYSLEDWSGD